MSDEEDFDEFPSITVNSSIHESSSFSMPSAEELATQRAREDACERELLLLREEHDALHRESADAAVAVTVAVAGVVHSDSSGSEGEAALAHAVSALRVRPAVDTQCGDPGRALRALALLGPQLPCADHLQRYLRAASDAGATEARALTAEVGRCAARMAAAAAQLEQRWADEELLGVAGWLCGVLCGPESAPRAARRPLARTLHLIIDDIATDQQVEALSRLLCAASLEAGAALELSDVLRGSSARGEALARAVAQRALAQLAGEPSAQDRSVSDIAGSLPAMWRRLAPPHQYLALQLLARLLPPRGGEGEGGAARRLLDALAQAARSQRTQSTDALKVLVAATKLQVLFHVRK